MCEDLVGALRSRQSEHNMAYLFNSSPSGQNDHHFSAVVIQGHFLSDFSQKMPCDGERHGGVCWVYVYTPMQQCNKSGGGILDSVCPSLCPSVSLSSICRWHVFIFNYNFKFHMQILMPLLEMPSDLMGWNPVWCFQSCFCIIYGFQVIISFS